MSCSADGGDYPQGLPGSEINSDYAGDSHGLHFNEASPMTAGICCTGMVR